MNTNKRYVFAAALGTVEHDTPEVIISFAGPRGGSRALVSTSPDEARALAGRLLTTRERSLLLTALEMLHTAVGPFPEFEQLRKALK